MSKERYQGIHDILNDQGFAMHYRAISNTVSHLEVFRCERINTAKQKDGLTFFLMLMVLEAKIFHYGFKLQNTPQLKYHSKSCYCSPRVDIIYIINCI